MKKKKILKRRKSQDENFGFKVLKNYLIETKYPEGKKKIEKKKTK